ncbi:MAG: ribosomal L7Ae/L30e/S12e/Gadd45 family protein [Lachnospiraceae bacterium]|nr:ribosomal L7Ae/L30e/S12e/Gadd45 family protein [Lachnoclostridium sp.]MDD7522104.1 ribosomal L7Ae/L30e/S12e/Gadd45 family protein [Lachnoclostridium sp.]MDY2599577.1 ribosomal L7Ae/L30e/S12e/Gadd45 family protein [Lachnospiraceae bacterium]
MIRSKVFSYIGLAMKSGNLVSGGFATEKAIKDYKAKVVIAADDLSENSRKKYDQMCEYYHVPMFYYGTKEELGHAIGKEYRAVLAIVDQGLAKAVIQSINQEVK